MKTCPKCGEMNGNENERCFKCGAALERTAAYQKICPQCGLVYAAKAEKCEKCGGPLGVYSMEAQQAVFSSGNSGDSGCWMYVATILIPIVGIVLGCIKIAQRENELGKSLIITAVVAAVAEAFLLGLLAACAA